MDKNYQQLKEEVDIMRKDLDSFYSSSTIPYNFENALRERLNNPSIYMGIVAPATTPRKLGDIFINTVLAKVYMATGLSSSSDWSILN